VTTNYVFTGHKFLEFVDSSKIIEEANEKLSSSIKIEDKKKLSTYFEEVIRNNPKDRYLLNTIFFEHIMYSRLRNIFVDRFNVTDNTLEVSTFNMKVKRILESFNNETRIPQALLSKMNDGKYYLMDMLDIKALGTKFIAGYDYTTNGDKVKTARFIFVQVVPRGTRIGYFIAGIDINFENGTCLTMIRNLTDIKDIENEKEAESKKNDENNQYDDYPKSFNRLYSTVKNLIVEPLINLESIDVKSDRKGMYNLCSNLLHNLLGDIHEEVLKATEEEVKDSVQTILRKLFPNDSAFIKTNTAPLGMKIQSMLCSAFISKKYKTKDIVKIAKQIPLKGYPTRIKFISSKFSKGAAQSGGSKIPVAYTDLFHSLYTEFEKSSDLEEWSISWFLDFRNTNPDNCLVSQTTIYAKQTSFRIVFLQKKSLGKEFIYHVIGELNHYR